LQPDSREKAVLQAGGGLPAGLAHLEKAAQLSGGAEPAILERLAAFYAETGRRQEAAAAAGRALEVARQRGDHALAERLSEMIRRLAN